MTTYCKFYISLIIWLFCTCCSPSVGGWCISGSIQGAKRNKTYIATYHVIEYQENTPLPKPDSVILEYRFICSNKSKFPRIEADKYQLVCFKDRGLYQFDTENWDLKDFKSDYVDKKPNAFRFLFDSLPRKTIIVEFISIDSTHKPIGKMVFERVEN